jgi:hypothetical protein
MGKKRADAVRAGRKAIKAGKKPRYRVRIERQEVPEMPWLDFGGDRPASIAKAARRAIAAELQVRPDQVEVEVDVD